MKTLTIQIGNTDGRLLPEHWEEFVAKTAYAVEQLADEVHFSGRADPGVPWTNACFVANMDAKHEEALRAHLRILAKKFGQDSIALTRGNTEFVSP